MNAMIDWNDISLVSPELFLAVAGMVLLIKGAFLGQKASRIVAWASVASFAVAAILLLRLDWGQSPVMNGMFTLDQFAGYLKLLVLGGMAATIMMSITYLERERIISPEYFVLHVFACLGIMLMISASNLLSFYVSLELQSLSIYVLAAIRKDRGESSEAGLKYFVLGALASGMLLFGMSLVYGFTGSLDFEGIDAAMRSSAAHTMPMIVGLVFIVAAVAFKISAVPFHMWTPDVYEGAPTSVTALMAIVPKVAALAVLIRLLFQPFGSIMDEWQQIVWFLAAASMIWSSFAALAQSNIKRLLAYSSIGNMGYALMSVAAGTPEGLGAVFIYMTIYMIMTAGIFAIVLTMRRNGNPAETVADFAGLSRTHPMQAYAMAILMFSLAGIPPLAGFFGKFAVFQAALAADMYWLAVIGVVMSVVAAFYYIRIIKVMFFDESAGAVEIERNMGASIVLGLSILFLLFFIVRPDPVINAARLDAVDVMPSTAPD